MYVKCQTGNSLFGLSSLNAYGWGQLEFETCEDGGIEVCLINQEWHYPTSPFEKMVELGCIPHEAEASGQTQEMARV